MSVLTLSYTMRIKGIVRYPASTKALCPWSETLARTGTLELDSEHTNNNSHTERNNSLAHLTDASLPVLCTLYKGLERT